MAGRGRTHVDKDGLNDFERALVDAYCATLSQKEAAQIACARYGAKTIAKSTTSAHFAKPHVQAVITKKMAMETTYGNKLRRTVVETLNACLEAELADCYDKDGKPLALRKMPKNARVALGEVTVKEWVGGTSIRFKMAGRAPILKLAMEHLGMRNQVDPMEGERRAIEDAGPTLNRRITELGDRLRKDAVPQLPDGGGTEATAV